MLLIIKLKNFIKLLKDSVISREGGDIRMLINFYSKSFIPWLKNFEKFKSISIALLKLKV